jgi:hypothetical protein
MVGSVQGWRLVREDLETVVLLVWEITVGEVIALNRTALNRMATAGIASTGLLYASQCQMSEKKNTRRKVCKGLWD